MTEQGQEAQGNQPAEKPVEKPADKVFTQAQVDEILHRRLEERKSKYSDYDEMKQKLNELEQIKNQQEQQDLEKRQEYDKLKDKWGETENQYKTIIEQKNSQLADITIKNSLVNEVIKNNAYPETVDLIKSNAVLEDGIVKVKGKDANGIESLLPIEEGVKQFLTQKPHLIKVSGKEGSGTPPAIGGGQIPTQDLASELVKARESGDSKKAEEIKRQIRAKHAQLNGASFV